MNAKVAINKALHRVMLGLISLLFMVGMATFILSNADAGSTAFSVSGGSASYEVGSTATFNVYVSESEPLYGADVSVSLSNARLVSASCSGFGGCSNLSGGSTVRLFGAANPEGPGYSGSQLFGSFTVEFISEGMASFNVTSGQIVNANQGVEGRVGTGSEVSVTAPTPVEVPTAGTTEESTGAELNATANEEVAQNPEPETQITEATPEPEVTQATSTGDVTYVATSPKSSTASAGSAVQMVTSANFSNGSSKNVTSCVVSGCSSSGTSQHSSNLDKANGLTVYRVSGPASMFGSQVNINSNAQTGTKVYITASFTNWETGTTVTSATRSITVTNGVSTSTRPAANQVDELSTTIFKVDANLLKCLNEAGETTTCPEFIPSHLVFPDAPSPTAIECPELTGAPNSCAEIDNKLFIEKSEPVCVTYEETGEPILGPCVTFSGNIFSPEPAELPNCISDTGAPETCVTHKGKIYIPENEPNDPQEEGCFDVNGSPIECVTYTGKLLVASNDCDPTQEKCDADEEVPEDEPSDEPDCDPAKAGDCEPDDEPQDEPSCDPTKAGECDPDDEPGEELDCDPAVPNDCDPDDEPGEELACDPAVPNDCEPDDEPECNPLTEACDPAPDCDPAVAADCDPEEEPECDPVNEDCDPDPECDPLLVGDCDPQEEPECDPLTEDCDPEPECDPLVGPCDPEEECDPVNENCDPENEPECDPLLVGDCDPNDEPECDPLTEACDPDPECDPLVGPCDPEEEPCDPLTENCDPENEPECDPIIEVCDTEEEPECDPVTQDCDPDIVTFDPDCVGPDCNNTQPLCIGPNCGDDDTPGFIPGYKLICHKVDNFGALMYLPEDIADKHLNDIDHPEDFEVNEFDDNPNNDAEDCLGIDICENLHGSATEGPGLCRDDILEAAELNLHQSADECESCVVEVPTEPNSPYCRQEFPVASLDTDGDGLTDRTECYLNTDYTDVDTDNDQCTDGYEHHTSNTNPHVPDCSPETMYSSIVITDPKEGWIVSGMDISGVTDPATVDVGITAFPAIRSVLNPIVNHHEQMARELNWVVNPNDTSNLEERRQLIIESNEAIKLAIEELYAFTENSHLEYTRELNIVQSVEAYAQKTPEEMLDSVQEANLLLNSLNSIQTGGTFLGLTNTFSDVAVGERTLKGFNLKPQTPLNDGMYDLVAVGRLPDGTITSEAVRITLDHEAIVEAPQPEYLDDVALTPDHIKSGWELSLHGSAKDLELSDIKVRIENGQPRVSGQTNGYQIFASWQSVTLSSSAIIDSPEGSFDMIAPGDLGEGAHTVTLYAISEGENGIIRSASSVVDFAIEAPGTASSVMLWVIAGLILVAVATAIAMHRMKKIDQLAPEHRAKENELYHAFGEKESAPKMPEGHAAHQAEVNAAFGNS